MSEPRARDGFVRDRQHRCSGRKNALKVLYDDVEVAAVRSAAEVAVAMQILGHSQISLTLGTDSHVVPELAEDAAERMSQALWGSPK